MGEPPRAMIQQPPPPEGAPVGSPRRRDRVRARLGPVGLVALGVVAAFVALAIYGAVAPAPPPLTRTDVNQAIATALASQTPPPAFSEGAYAAVRPALVVVQAQVGAAPAPTSPATTSPAPAGTRVGSGVVVDASGDILTSLHVVDGANAIELTFADGTQSAAQVVSTQPADDIAVLQATQPPATLTPAVLGNPGAMRVGSEAYVVGNPLGLTGSLSAGVVSGLDRSFQLPDGSGTIDGLIQVDAAVNPGNSGGPLLDRDGRVVGIVTGLVNPTGQDAFAGIGFAVPINVAGGAAGLPQY